MAKDFSVFGDARHKIAGGDASKSRDMYFATYQSIARDESRPGLYREYPQDFFDLVIVDECHRGSARDDSNWREILEWFKPATQIGMTATPRREDNVDTYAYFGDPIYEYNLAQGIADGFLAPFRVHRVITDYDAAGWRPSRGEIDRYGRAVPDAEYHTADFERLIAIRARTRAIARHLAGFMRRTDRFAKTIVFLRRPGARAGDARRARRAQPRSGQGAPRLCMPGDRRRGACRQRSPGQVPGRGDAFARHPDHLPTADHRRRRSDVQERGAGPGRRLDARVQADHRTRHATAHRLRQARVQHHRLHGHRHREVRGPRFRRRPAARAGRRHRPAGGDGRGAADPGAGARSLSPVPGR